MIQEISNLVESLGEMRDFGLKPREGLHILLQLKADGKVSLLQKEVYAKKDKAVSEFLLECARREQNAWCINTDKCLDLPAKGIQTCSPYCIGFKKDSLPGGQKYTKDKINIFDRIGPYFDKAATYLEVEEDQQRSKAFKHFCQNDLYRFLQSLPEYEARKEAEYIVLYLNLPPEKFREPHERYLKERLFNTANYNVQDEAGETYGTSNFFCGYNSKKPFLVHQTAAFDINGRISGKTAQHLHEFEQIALRGVLPNPVPIFIYREELEQDENLNIRVVKFFNKEERRIGYREIIESIREEERQNYYLLFFRAGEVKDFDFVSKFNFALKDEKAGEPFWVVKNLFHLKEKQLELPRKYIRDIFEFQNEIIQLIFNNALVQRSKEGRLNYRYFDDIDPAYCSAATYQMVMKYRKAVYDFIYKSRRQVITGTMFKDMMLTGILDAVNRNNEWGAKEKLNIFFSLNHHFDNDNQNFNGYFMPDKLDELMEKTMLIADSKERVAVSSPEEFAFISGQMIDYLLDQSRALENTHALLEPFLQKTQLAPFKDEIIRTFYRYKHEIERKGGRRVKNLMREICGYDQPINVKEYMSYILAGYFSPSFYYTKKEISTETE